MTGLNVLFEQAKEEKRSLTSLEQVVKNQKSGPSELQHHPRIKVMISKYAVLTQSADHQQRTVLEKVHRFQSGDESSQL